MISGRRPPRDAGMAILPFHLPLNFRAAAGCVTGAFAGGAGFGAAERTGDGAACFFGASSAIFAGAGLGVAGAAEGEGDGWSGISWIGAGQRCVKARKAIVEQSRRVPNLMRVRKPNGYRQVNLLVNAGGAIS